MKLTHVTNPKRQGLCIYTIRRRYMLTSTDIEMKVWLSQTLCNEWGCRVKVRYCTGWTRELWRAPQQSRSVTTLWPVAGPGRGGALCSGCYISQNNQCVGVRVRSPGGRRRSSTFFSSLLRVLVRFRALSPLRRTPSHYALVLPSRNWPRGGVIGLLCGGLTAGTGVNIVASHRLRMRVFAAEFKVCRQSRRCYQSELWLQPHSHTYSRWPFA